MGDGRQADMRVLTTLLVTLAFVLIFVPGSALGEYYGIPQQTFTINTEEIVTDFGLSHDTRVVMVNTGQLTELNPALVIMGSDVDQFERAGFARYLAGHPVYPPYILNDSARSIAGSSIDDFDLIVVGGPEHNAYARELLDRGVLRYNGTDLRMPGLIVESVSLPSGHTILVIGSVASYPGYVPDDLVPTGIPENEVPVAAVATGTILGMAGIYLSQLYSQVFSFIYGYVTTLAGEVASEKETEIRHLKAHKPKKSLLFGQSWQEITLAVSCVIMFAIAYVIADRLDMLPENIAMYILVGGFVVTAHDVGHRIVAYLLKMDAEFQFWGLGALTMLLTSWLFSMVFAQPSRVLLEKDQHSEDDVASVMLAGPVVSLFLSLAFLLLAMFGGSASEIGFLGFTMNMVTVVYSLMPFNPMDGKSIYEWNKKYWAVLFVPISVLFIIVTWFGIVT